MQYQTFTSSTLPLSFSLLITQRINAECNIHTISSIPFQLYLKQKSYTSSFNSKPLNSISYSHILLSTNNFVKVPPFLDVFAVATLFSSASLGVVTAFAQIALFTHITVSPPPGTKRRRPV